MKIIKTVNRLNIREKASLNADVLGIITTNAEYEAEPGKGKQTGWYKLDQGGYVKGEFVSEAADESESGEDGEV
jgi:hypothetical protein